MSGQGKSNKTALKVFLALLFIVYAGLSSWYILHLRKTQQDLNNKLSESKSALEKIKQDILKQPDEVIANLRKDTTNEVLEAVKKLYALPEGETPTIATVEDISKLKDQPFFAEAQNGDVLIIYEKNAQAIIYRPADNKLVKVGPINAGAVNSAAQPADSTQTQPSGQEP